MDENLNNKQKVKHHEQLTVCETRPAYRQGKKFTAIKCYTVVNESQHLFIYGVPQIGLRAELKRLCTKYGKVTKIEVTTLSYETEVFTDCYHVLYETIEMARKAKRQLDTRNFYGGILHVCYAPERETLDETKSKLDKRQRQVINYKH